MQRPDTAFRGCAGRLAGAMKSERITGKRARCSGSYSPSGVSLSRKRALPPQGGEHGGALGSGGNGFGVLIGG